VYSVLTKLAGLLFRLFPPVTTVTVSVQFTVGTAGLGVVASGVLLMAAEGRRRGGSVLSSFLVSAEGDGNFLSYKKVRRVTLKTGKRFGGNPVFGDLRCIMRSRAQQGAAASLLFTHTARRRHSATGSFVTMITTEASESPGGWPRRNRLNRPAEP